MRKQGTFIDITDIDLRKEDLSWLKDIIKNRQNEAALEDDEEVVGICMRLLVVISYLITGLDNPRKLHFVKDQKARK